MIIAWSYKIKIFNFKIISITLFFFCALVFHLGWQNKTSFEKAIGLDKLSSQDKKALFEIPKALNDWKISWLGHNGYYLENKNIKVLLDPVHDISIKGVSRKFDTFNPSSFEKIDYVIISHAHFDHMSLNTISKMKKIETLIIPKGYKELFKEFNISKIIEVIPGETLDLKLKISVLKAQHNGSRYHPFKSSCMANSYLLDDKKTSIYFAGDTGFGEHIFDIAKKFHPDISILPIGAFEPNFILNYYHMNPKEALKAMKILGSEVMIPSHFGTYRLSLDLTSEALIALMQYNKPFNQKIYLPKLYVSKTD
ncbi:MAG: hypothetical protein COB02_11565 [Candidatus Cloacimonadota bacterium]|nr:MAG: hypothetical protein COB02_11565 [Candidatus Cloacimonadota bacterium]